MPRRLPKKQAFRACDSELCNKLSDKGVTGDPNALRDLFKATIDILNSNGHRIADGVAEYCQTVFDTSMPGSDSFGTGL